MQARITCEGSGRHQRGPAPQVRAAAWEALCTGAYGPRKSVLHHQALPRLTCTVPGSLLLTLAGTDTVAFCDAVADAVLRWLYYLSRFDVGS